MVAIRACDCWGYGNHSGGRGIEPFSFGLLDSANLAKALKKDPGMPKSRRLCAVPFTGKDVPSVASEFSHPDVVIGLTILAYRYEGMRESDFRTAMAALIDQMAHEVRGLVHLVGVVCAWVCNEVK